MTVRVGVAGGAAGGLRLRSAPSAPAAVQGDRLGQAEERQGGCGDLGAAAARRPDAGGAGDTFLASSPGRSGLGHLLRHRYLRSRRTARGPEAYPAMAAVA